MLPTEELETSIRQFSGTEAYHRHSFLFPNFVMTDGVKWLADNAECHWLMDVIASYQPRCLKDSMLKNIQFWTLKVNADKTATLICERDAGDEFLRQEFDYTNFPLSEIKLYVGREQLPSGQSVSVVLLPSEY